MTLILQCDMCIEQINLKTLEIHTDYENRIKQLGWQVFKGGGHTCTGCNAIENELQKQINNHRDRVKTMHGVFAELAIQQEMKEKPIIIVEQEMKLSPTIETMRETDKRPVYRCRYCKIYFERTMPGMAKIYGHEKKDHADVYVALIKVLPKAKKGDKRSLRREMVWISWTDPVVLDKKKRNKKR